jgi:hypothetical protein
MKDLIIIFFRDKERGNLMLEFFNNNNKTIVTIYVLEKCGSQNIQMFSLYYWACMS